MAGEFHVVTLVHFHLGQVDLSLELLDHPQQVGGERVARRAPVCPEVDEDGALVRGGDDSLLEVREMYVENVGTRVFEV
jgi:hypothetical protein